MVTISVPDRLNPGLDQARRDAKQLARETGKDVEISYKKKGRSRSSVYRATEKDKEIAAQAETQTKEQTTPLRSAPPNAESQGGVPPLDFVRAQQMVNLEEQRKLAARRALDRKQEAEVQQARSEAEKRADLLKDIKAQQERQKENEKRLGRVNDAANALTLGMGVPYEERNFVGKVAQTTIGGIMAGPLAIGAGVSQGIEKGILAARAIALGDVKNVVMESGRAAEQSSQVFNPTTEQGRVSLASAAIGAGFATILSPPGSNMPEVVAFKTTEQVVSGPESFGTSFGVVGKIKAGSKVYDVTGQGEQAGIQLPGQNNVYGTAGQDSFTITGPKTNIVGETQSKGIASQESAVSADTTSLQGKMQGKPIDTTKQTITEQVVIGKESVNDLSIVKVLKKTYESGKDGAIKLGPFGKQTTAEILKVDQGEVSITTRIGAELSILGAKANEYVKGFEFGKEPKSNVGPSENGGVGGGAAINQVQVPSQGGQVMQASMDVLKSTLPGKTITTTETATLLNPRPIVEQTSRPQELTSIGPVKSSQNSKDLTQNKTEQSFTFDQPTGIKQEEKISQSSMDKIAAEPPKPILKPKPEQEQKPKSLPDLKPEMTPKEEEDVISITKPGVDTIQEQQSQRPSAFGILPTVPPEQVFPRGFAVIGGVPVPKNDVMQGQYVVEVRRRGVFTPLPGQYVLKEAVNRGVVAVEGSAAASFRLKQGGRIVLDAASKNLGKRFRASKTEPGVFVQRRQFRISSAGEKRDITFKGLAVSRTNKKRRGWKLNVFGGRK